MKRIFVLIIAAFLLVTAGFAQAVVVTNADPVSNAGSPYTTLKAAFDNINLVSQAGNNIEITISGTTIEAVTAVLNQSVGPWNSLTITPVGTAAVTGNINGVLVSLTGADDVTIDGLNSGGNSLIFSNTSGLGSAITLRFVSDASNNSITRCTLLGSSGALAASGLATVYFAIPTTTGNDNNTVSDCIISASATGTPRYAIQSAGSGAAVNNNNTISGNNISDFFHPAVASGGINLGVLNSDWTITNNRLYQTATRTATTANTHNGILISSGAGYTISGNIIGFANASGTGTTNMIGLTSGALGGTFPSAFTSGGTPNATRFNAIQCAFTAGGAVSSIQNNTIAGIALYTTGAGATTFGLICGIAVTSGNANIGTVTGNTIGSSTGTGSIYAATAQVAGVISGIYCTSTNTINIQNNIMGGIDVSGTAADFATGFKGIEVAGTGTFTISNNTIGNAVANNIRTGYLLTGTNLSNTATTPTPASGAPNVRGIVSAASGTSLTISNNIMQGFQSSGTGSLYRAISNSGAVTGAINITGNQIGTAGNGAVNYSVATAGGIHGIYNNGAAATSTINITGNTIQGISLVASGIFGGIDNTDLADSDVAINISDNQFGTATGSFVTYSAATSNLINAIVNAGGTTNCVVTIQNNSIRGIVHSVTASSNHAYISSTAVGIASVNILDNMFNNLNVNTSGNVILINKSGAMFSGASATISNNSIVGSFSKTASGSSVRGYYSTGASVSGSAVTITNNNFSNFTVTGSTFFVGIEDSDGASGLNGPTKNISANTISNINMGTGGFYGLQLSLGDNVNISLNSITNVTGSGRTYGIYIGTVLGLLEISYNTINSLSSSGDVLWGIVHVGGASIKPPVNNVIHHNSITGLSGGLGNNSIFGIFIQDFEILNIYDNDINSFTATGMSQIYGIACSYYYRIGTTLNVYRNNIHNLEGSNTNSRIKGMDLAGPVITVNVYNNFISDLKAPNASSTIAVTGIIAFTTLPATTNLYNNSIYLNASSTGTNFGTAGIYHLASTDPAVIALKMVNNIVVNTSTANGTGVTAAFWREGTALNNYAATSNYNLFYAGTPGVKNLIYYDYTISDQTLAAYQARVSPRDANSISVMPAFVSATDLHLTAANCMIDGRGIPVAGITDDIDLDARHATTPDIGADEFTATTSTVLAGSFGGPVCEDRTIAIAGTTFTSNACDLIARVVPSGGEPVAGNVNVCVTLDAVQQYFNGDPYVQRHFDLEPVNSNQTTTSATITLYFTNAEFVLYNTNNPVRPPLPTLAGGGNADPNRANVKVTQFHGAAQTSPSSPGNYPGVRELIVPTPANVFWNGNFWEITFNINGFSGFYVHSNIWSVPLPVTVNYFNGAKQNGNHLLNWKVTCVSTPHATLELQRSSDGGSYATIYSIYATALRCQQPFDFTDNTPAKGTNYYRLKMTDADGKVTYSSIVHLINASKGMDILNIAPNPIVNGNFNLKISAAENVQMELVITDMQGRVLQTQKLGMMAGFNSIPVNVRNLAAGTYQLFGHTAEGRTRVLRFVIQ